MKKYLDLLKDNFNLLVAVPPLFGAIWQLIELSKMSLSYIRFFSLSQLVADGVLFLIIIILLLITTLTLNLLFLNEIKEEESNIIINSFFEPKKDNKLISILFLVLGISIIFYFVPSVNEYFLKQLDSIYIIIIVLPLNFSLFFLGLSFTVKGVKGLENSKSNKISKNIESVIFTVIIFFFFFFLRLYYIEFNNLMLLPNNLENVQVIEKDIKTKNPNTTVTLRYLNDKYIFYSIVDKNKKEKIKIVKFDNLFEE